MQKLSPEEKIKKIEFHFLEIMKIIWIPLTDSTKKTPQRIGKMFTQEIFSWLNKDNFPKIMKIKNKPNINYHDIILEKNIPFYSTCEHHFLPIIWVVHIAYLPDHEIIWLSKLNRIVDFFSKKPQIQERCTQEIYQCLYEILGIPDIAVVIQAQHMCVSMRWVKHTPSETITLKIWWKISRWEILQMLKNN